MQETACLKLELINGWLFGVDESRVKDEEIRQRVLSYKRECYSVLFKHFYGRNLSDKQPAEVPASTDANEPMVVRKGLVTEARHTFNIQSARELWCKLNLPTTPSMFREPLQSDFFHYNSIQKVEPLEKGVA